ncbi:MAG: hypothetical protein KI785_00410 [Devosiaceae bacterium]|nr:hypothetical protein [Devosiaceae bacterium MH13]
MDLFHAFVWGHILFGAPGLIAFWVPVIGKKGGSWHVWVGRFFTAAMLITASFAVLISLTTLYDPAGTHPHLMSHPDFGSETVIRDIFGWLMLYLGILTLNLAWYGWTTVRNKTDRNANRSALNLFLQAALLVAAINCAWRGLADGQVLMIGISTIGFATVATNMWFLYKPRPDPRDWLREHLKALVGTGISVYTAFFAFGAVRLLPEAALTPALWSVPLVVGVSIILFQWNKLRSPKRRHRAPPVQPAE